MWLYIKYTDTSADKDILFDIVESSKVQKFSISFDKCKIFKVYLDKVVREAVIIF